MWDSRLSHLSALRGQTWPLAVQAWVHAGGFMRLAQGQISLGDLVLQGAGGPLVADEEGRLSGSLPLTLEGGQSGHPGGVANLMLHGPIPLRFERGRASIGPIPIGPALKVG